MPLDFEYDVFLSHSSKDKAVVRDVADRLRGDGLRVWFDEWELRPGDSIPAKIEIGLERSRVLVLCMSAHAFGSDWAQLEAGTFRFRDPLNQERRFIPLRLDDAPIKGSLAQFLFINWLPQDREEEYAKLLEACRSTAKETMAETRECGRAGYRQGHPARLRGLRISLPTHSVPMASAPSPPVVTIPCACGTSRRAAACTYSTVTQPVSGVWRGVPISATSSPALRTRP